MADHVKDEDFDLLSQLEVDTSPEKKGGLCPREQRIIAGFEEIQRFAMENGRVPGHGENADIFERMYAVRLDRIRASAECRAVLEGRDVMGLLSENHSGAACVREGTETDDALLEELGVSTSPAGELGELKYVRSRQEIQSAEEVAQRTPCADFATFKPLFKRVQQDLDRGIRQTLKFQDNAEVKRGDWFILDGHKLLVAALGEEVTSGYGRPNRRLRVIYDNGTESDLLLRSLQRALNKDKASRRITDPNLGPLFSSEGMEGDVSSGTVYVLRSQSDHPFIRENREVIHKIGVTGGKVAQRIANAKKDPTYLLADVEIVASYALANVNRTKLEKLLHRLFAEARLDLDLKDRFGQDVEPREWFLIPLPVIEEAIERILDGTISEYQFHPKEARLIKTNTPSDEKAHDQ